MTYPPEPWHLRGQMYLSIFSVPVDRLPGVPEPLRRLRIGRRTVVAAAWVAYQPGGVLSYLELLCAVPVRKGLRPTVTITDIWVDSAPSRDGGRALWGIPKELAKLSIEPAGAHVDASIDVAGSTVAAATVTPGRRLTGRRWPVAFTVTQLLDGALKTSPVRSRGRVALGRAQWTVDPAGPLGYLAGRRPRLTLALGDFDLMFGRS